MQRLIINEWDKFWMFTVIKEVESKIVKWKKQRWFLFRCECWTEKERLLYTVKAKQTKSCWCLIWHWMSGARIYRIWAWMKQRCNNPNNEEYHNYWWRGIKVCEEWEDFKIFHKDMWISHEIHYKKNKQKYKRNTSIERIDVNWNYELENCTWATTIEQGRNRRTNRIHKWKTISEWCEIQGIRRWVVDWRLYSWWDIDRALELK